MALEQAYGVSYGALVEGYFRYTTNGRERRGKKIEGLNTFRLAMRVYSAPAFSFRSNYSSTVPGVRRPKLHRDVRPFLVVLQIEEQSLPIPCQATTAADSLPRLNESSILRLF